MTPEIRNFSFDGSFPYVLVFSTGLAILCLATVYITSSLVLH
jgi:hypothetical protein